MTVSQQPAGLLSSPWAHGPHMAQPPSATSHGNAKQSTMPISTSASVNTQYCSGYNICHSPKDLGGNSPASVLLQHQCCLFPNKFPITACNVYQYNLLPAHGRLPPVCPVLATTGSKTCCTGCCTAPDMRQLLPRKSRWWSPLDVPAELT